MKNLAMNKKTKTPVIKKPTLKERQDEFVERVNKIGDELEIAVTAKLSFTEDGVIPKLYLADVSAKSKKK